MVAGVLHTAQARDSSAAALGTVPWVARLAVEPAQVREQLRGRCPAPARAPHLQRHLVHAPVIDEDISGGGIAGAVVATAGPTARQVAGQVLESMPPGL